MLIRRVGKGEVCTMNLSDPRDRSFTKFLYHEATSEYFVKLCTLF